MSGERVTDPEILKQLNDGRELPAEAPSSPSVSASQVVTDPNLLARLNSDEVPASAAPAAQAPVYPGGLTAADQEIAGRLAARRGWVNSAWKGFTLNFDDEIAAAIGAIPSALAHGTSIQNSYRRLLNINRESQRIYENANAINAGVAEFAGGMANPLNRILGGPIAKVGGKVGSYVASKVDPRWGGKALGDVANMVSQATLHGGAYGAAQKLGATENITPSEYIPTAAEGVVEGAEYAPAAALGIAGLVKGGGTAWNRAIKPTAGVIGDFLSPRIPEAMAERARDFSESVSRSAAGGNVARAIDEIGNTINTRNAEAGKPPIDPLNAIRQQILPPLPAKPESRAMGVKNLDQAEKIVSNIDALDKAAPVTEKRGGMTDARRKQVVTDLVSKDLTTEQRVEAINAKKFLTPEQKASIIASIRENPIEGSERVPVGKALSYYRDFENKQQIPSNLIEHASAVAQEAGSKGAEAPVLELSRVAAGAGGAEKSLLSAELVQRQTEQGSRMASHIEKAAEAHAPAGDFQNLDQARTAAENLTSTAATEMYNKARANARPIDLREKLGEYSLMAKSMGGNVKENISKAIRIFKGVHHEESPYGPPDERMRDLRETFKGHEYQTDVNRFMNAREQIDDLIKHAEKLGHGSSVRVLNQFRTDMNDIARKKNPALARADQTFSEGKSIEKIVDTAHEASTKLNYKSEDTIKYFDSLTPEQKTLFRMAFANNMKQYVAERPENSAFVAGKFQNKATRKMIEHIFGPDVGGKLNQDISREAATTATLHHAFGGSRTAPMGEAISQFRMGAELPVQTALSWWNPMRVAHKAEDALRYSIANRQANHIGRMLTNTDPIQNLKTINFLQKAREQGGENAQSWGEKAFRAGARTAPLLINAPHQVGLRPEREYAE